MVRADLPVSGQSPNHSYASCEHAPSFGMGRRAAKLILRHPGMDVKGGCLFSRGSACGNGENVVK